MVAKLADVRKLEDAMEARVKAGYCQMEAIETMISDGRAVIRD